jgi:trehalose/maltose hydrolase-like predicted phosphorylase
LIVLLAQQQFDDGASVGQKTKVKRAAAGLISVLFVTAGNSLAESPWEIVAKEIDPDEYYGVTVANGVIGIVSSPEPLRIQDVVLNGVFDNYQRGRVANILKGFNHLQIDVAVDGVPVNRKDVTDYQQTLDMREAKLITTFAAPGITVRHEVMALRHLPYTALINVVITNGPDAVVIAPAAVIEAPDHLRDVRNFYATIDRPHVRIPLLTSVAKSPTGRHTIAASTSFVFPEQHGQEPDLIHEDWHYNLHLMKFSKRLSPGQTYRFSVVASTCASEHCSDPHNEAERLTIFAALEGAERLMQLHRDAWDELWSTGNVFVEGDVRAERDIRFALYHLYSFARAGTSHSLSPMGLSGLGYNGHVFWDTELWMYPPLLILQPEIARSLLEYRYERLDAARQNAFAHGYDGAMFPWESADDGSEVTPVWALTGPFQHHITGCVAWAHWKYYQATGDKDWLLNRGWPVIAAAADFWASRVDRTGPGAYDINNVIGANEWQENVDNNAFTNAIAITTLRYASEAASVLGLEANPDWKHVAENIPILKFPDGTTRENRTFDGSEIKQADVNLLSYPIEIVTDPAQIRKDLEYYEPRMSPLGPAMGNAILSVLYNRLGEAKKAEQIFARSYKPNEVPPFGVISETAGGTNPYFATGAGGMLQAVLAGFGGLRITDDGIVQTPSTIPAKWKSLRIVGAGKNDMEFAVGE